jgi:predicted component of type VI protein secretion system
MDDAQTPAQEGQGLQGPHWPRSRLQEGELLPLRLVLKTSGWSMELTRPEMILGRHTDADIRLPLPDVSRRHCRFVFAEGIWHVFDLNSLNGIYVNGQQVRHAVVHHRDELRIGGFTFLVEMGSRDSTVELPSEGVLQQIADSLPEAEQRKAS